MMVRWLRRSGKPPKPEDDQLRSLIDHIILAGDLDEARELLRDYPDWQTRAEQAGMMPALLAARTRAEEEIAYHNVLADIKLLQEAFNQAKAELRLTERDTLEGYYDAILTYAEAYRGCSDARRHRLTIALGQSWDELLASLDEAVRMHYDDLCRQVNRSESEFTAHDFRRLRQLIRDTSISGSLARLGVKALPFPPGYNQWLIAYGYLPKEREFDQTDLKRSRFWTKDDTIKLMVWAAWAGSHPEEELDAERVVAVMWLLAAHRPGSYPGCRISQGLMEQLANVAARWYDQHPHAVELKP